MGDTFIPRLMHPDDQAVLPMIAKDYDIRKDGEIFEHIFRFKHKNGQWRWLHRIATIFSRTPDGRPKQILGTIADITRFKQAERDLQELSARLLTAQDEERRRIARELHDVTGQNLGVIAVHLGTLERRSGEIAPGVRELLSECQRLCSESQKEIRALSYLLHPPELDLLGLVGALRGYLQGYEKRTGIRAILDVKKDIGRLPSELETDLFRVVQEGLTNIMRHSGSETAVVRLEKSETHITLQVEDKGRGLPSQLDSAERQLIGFGVGITGMRERLRQHGGTLEIHSSPHGTILRGVVPLNPPGR
jgi:signal transduction histidine kinase